MRVALHIPDMLEATMKTANVLSLAAAALALSAIGASAQTTVIEERARGDRAARAAARGGG
jgi:hypothetical protein